MWSKKPYLLFLLIFLIGYTKAAGAGNPLPDTSKAVIDLRNNSLNQAIHLDYKWEFYWNQLIDPQDTMAKIGELVNFPHQWKSFGFATYKVTILLPKKKGTLLLKMPETYSAYRLYINSKLEAHNGKVSTNKADFIPYWKAETVPILATVDTLNLLLQVSNFAHSKGGVKKSLTIGNRDTLILQEQQSAAINLILTGCMLMGGLFFMGLYLLGKNDKVILLFALFSIVYSYRMIGTDTYVLHTIIPDLSWYLTLRLESIFPYL
ncbi:hypothetical protein [Pedobacter steynii]